MPASDGGCISFNDADLPEEFKQKYGFDPKVSNPVGMVVNRNAESYTKYQQRVVPHTVWTPGQIFGLARPLSNLAPTTDSVQPFFTWELRAGIRSLVILPHITDVKKISRLNKIYDCKVEKPNSMYDHWRISRELIIKNQVDWKLEVLFFSNSWFESLKDEQWSKLLIYLQRAHRATNKIWHNIPSWLSSINNVEIKEH